MPKIIKAIIPVAGLGTRFLPASKAVPKELLPILDRPLLQLIVEEIASAGIEEIIFVISPEKNEIEKFFARDEKLEKKLVEKGKTELLTEIQKISEIAKFSFVEQVEALGDGHAILQAREKIGDENFLVVFGDDLLLGEPTRQLLEAYEEKNGPIVGLQKVAPSEVEKFGIVGLGENDVIEKFVEKPKAAEAPSDLAIVGRYICPPEIMEILAQNPSQSGEIRLIDALEILQKQTQIFGKVLEGQRFDCGQKTGWLAANLHFAKQDPEIAKFLENA